MIYLREDKEEVLRALEDQYPKTFFDNPKLRRPLSKTILKELHADGFPMSPELVRQAVEWYQSHIGYRGYAMSRAGTRRVNLKGEDVEAVTEAEARRAQDELRNFHAAQNAERDAASTRNRETTTIRTYRAPPETMTKLTTTTNNIATELMRLNELLGAINSALASTNDPALRSAIACAAIEELIREGRSVIAGLTTKPRATAA
jgi:sRNA-binding protein